MIDKGVYLITNKINNKIYVGSSVYLRRRQTDHIYLLQNNKHGNKHLQRAWNKYGESNFEFTILERIYDDEDVIPREQYWMDKLDVCNPTIGYNTASIAYSNLGFKMSDESKLKMAMSGMGRITTEETRLKLSKSKTKAMLSEETLKKYSENNTGSNNPCAKLDEGRVSLIKMLLLDNISHKKIARIFHVSSQLIDQIALKKIWSHVV